MVVLQRTSWWSLYGYYIVYFGYADISVLQQIKLGEVVEEGFMALIHDKANQVKILVDPSA